MRYFLMFITLSITLTACLTQKDATNTDNSDDENGESALENASFKALLESIEEGFDNEKGDLLFLKVHREPEILGKEMTIVVSNGAKSLKTENLSVFYEDTDANLVGKVINTIQNQAYKLIESNTGGLSGNEHQDRILTANYIFKKTR